MIQNEWYNKKEKVMKMKPIGDQILLKKQKGQEKTKSGLILTSSTSNYQYADVIAVGPGLFTQTGDRIPMTIKANDQVLLHSRLLKGDNEIELDNEKYVLVRESEIAMYNG
jgi:chaperonin GroES